MDSHWLGTIAIFLLCTTVYAKPLLDKLTALKIRRKENLSWRSLAISWKSQQPCPSRLNTTVINGVLYLGTGALFIAWPGLVQAVFKDAAFVGHEEALFRVVGLLLVVVGWLYLFGGRSGGPQVCA
jgi:hypothetical protein